MCVSWNGVKISGLDLGYGCKNLQAVLYFQDLCTQSRKGQLFLLLLFFLNCRNVKLLFMKELKPAMRLLSLKGDVY